VVAASSLTKPFSPRELVARVKAMLRRPRTGTAAARETEEAPQYRFGSIVVDEGRHEVTKDGRAVPLTAREFALLAKLAAHRGRVFTRAQLLESVWGDEYFDDHVVDVHVSNLRHKLEDDPAQPLYLETVRGVGYRLGDRAG
jgi:two-component system, OmpR family, alkaline phosphatase synthesis response regulator PhoP